MHQTEFSHYIRTDLLREKMFLLCKYVFSFHRFAVRQRSGH